MRARLYAYVRGSLKISKRTYIRAYMYVQHIYAPWKASLQPHAPCRLVPPGRHPSSPCLRPRPSHARPPITPPPSWLPHTTKTMQSRAVTLSCALSWCVAQPQQLPPPVPPCDAGTRSAPPANIRSSHCHHLLQAATAHGARNSSRTRQSAKQVSSVASVSCTPSAQPQ